MQIKRVAITEKGKKYFIKNKSISLNISEGEIPRLDMDKNLVTTTKGENIHLYDANFKDNFVNIQKPAAIINPKDAGMIIAYTAMTKNFVVIDAGAGSGALACTLASLCKKVYCYDINQKHVDAVNQNIKDLDLDNITCELKNIYNCDEINIKEKVDLMTIDVPEPEKIFETAKKCLKEGGYLVLYTPQIYQAQNAILKLDNDFHYEFTTEIIKRDWEIDEKKLRPAHTMLGHTAFLTFIRFYPKKVEMDKSKLKKKSNPRKEARLERLSHKKVISEEEQGNMMSDF
jgi:tRNA (adenine57-N1/adenine58-N1)-methyltransferase catalytic subunit